MRRRLFHKKSGAIKLDLCDVILYDNVDGRLYQTSDFSSLDPSRYEPIGIVVIPTAHDVYGTGECGVMALMSASLTTPDAGQTSNTSIYWGQYQVDIPELANLNLISAMGTMDGDIEGTITGTKNYGYMPQQRSGMSVKCACPHDPIANYYKSTSSTYGYIPSPYLTNGSRNPDYYKTDSPSSTLNAMADFDGKSNTEILISKATAQVDWKTNSTITNNSASGYSPAACCCWRFHASGTNQGDWYLPACGELGYIAPRYDMINQTISMISAWSGKSFASLTTNTFWSSSEYSSTYARLVNFYSGNVINYNKRSGYYVRPFLRGSFPVLHGAR